jgi:catechol 2,3-dioxygenase-like lactoylglutathione lyase family enzyme
MADNATPNLPARDHEKTKQFYSTLGFVATWQDEHWMILRCGELVLEFFHHASLQPEQSWFSCCLRLDDLDEFVAKCQSAGIPVTTQGWPRLHLPKQEAWGGHMGALIDIDGTLLRLIQN